MNKCDKHDKDLDLLCSDCKSIICYRCLVAKHHQHRTYHTDDIKQSLLNIDYSAVFYGSYIDNDEDNNNKDYIFQDRIEWLWNKLYDLVDHIQEMSKVENEISNHFKQYYEMLMKEERKLKQPIIDEIDQTKQQLDQIIKEIQSLHNIIQSITPTLKPDLKNNDIDNHTNNNNNEYDILPDISTSYEIPTLIESIKQSKSFEQFIHNNSNTLFNIQQQNNNEIIEYLNNNNEINKNKRHKNNDNNKTNNNNNDNSILEIIRNHIDKHNIDEDDIDMNDSYVFSKSDKFQSYFEGVRHFVQESYSFNDYNRKDDDTDHIKHIITKNDDNVLSLYKWDNEMELLENESKELAKLLEEFVRPEHIFFGSTKTTIYIFSMLRPKFIVYSIKDKTFRKGSYESNFHLLFISPPSTTFTDPFNLYFYGKSFRVIDNIKCECTKLVRFNTILEEFELLSNEENDHIFPMAIFHHDILQETAKYSIHYDSNEKQIVRVLFHGYSTTKSSEHIIVSDIVPKYIASCFDGYRYLYVYYGDKDTDYFIKFDNYDKSPSPNENLPTIEGRLPIEEQENPVSMLYKDTKIYLFTKDQNFVYSLNDKKWRQSNLDKAKMHIYFKLIV
ncbi:hypothetical protein PPL_08363 [Heterostelium album PN500]|uniref:B box-type domain-containing protein n=1 Tax=Heterostelium pallidum (strain ATCC 26659 / Pp 5 / PN500) TaxID=670386 RepID=D3BHZ5_HETP5|nr:hypothetical protein PPL_08363 [Heterostelium album PN500]EFA78895.1 hypothetical protein PPL_08363 [Heterostelium album PN500]|eukprot:XP_020431019.1 hypothetical protein PPL_08363 [Heterostelium album PN500]